VIVNIALRVELLALHGDVSYMSMSSTISRI
jgi:hypothetical protein